MSETEIVAVKGSQAWMQRAVSERSSCVEQALKHTLGAPDAEVSWKSPLPPTFSEARDASVFRLLGIMPERRALNDFWPRGGPVWDGLAVVDGRYVLIEAKAHIPELLSGGSKALGNSLAQIQQSLERTRKALAPRSRVDWSTSPFFQYANRLAYLQFLREDNGIDAHLAFIYFTNDSEMSGPETSDEWRGALKLMEASLGLGRHSLSAYVHKLFVDCRLIGAPVV